MKITKIRNDFNARKKGWMNLPLKRRKTQQQWWERAVRVKGTDEDEREEGRVETKKKYKKYRKKRKNIY